MVNNKKDPLGNKSFLLAIQTVKLSKKIRIDHKEFVLSQQLLKAGTNPGAMVREAKNAESTKDFIHKLSIAQKEIVETQYWLELLLETNYIDQNEFQNIYDLSTEVLKLLTSSIKTMKLKLINN